VVWVGIDAVLGEGQNEAVLWQKEERTWRRIGYIIDLSQVLFVMWSEAELMVMATDLQASCEAAVLALPPSGLRIV
jgi:hypothetical protein